MKRAAKLSNHPENDSICQNSKNTKMTMLAKKHRYTFRKGIPGRSYSSSNFRIAYNIRNSEGLNLAVVVSKKVDKRAVERNRIKRMITAIIEQLVSKQTSADLVFFIRKSILNAEKDQIYNEIQLALKQINLYK